MILKSYRRDVLRALINPVFVDFPQTLWASSVSDCDIFRWIEWVDTPSLDFPHNYVTCSFLTPCDHFQMDSTGHWTQAVTGTRTHRSGYPETRGEDPQQRQQGRQQSDQNLQHWPPQMEMTAGQKQLLVNELRLWPVVRVSPGTRGWNRVTLTSA